jgi:hypothetical protein
MQTYNISAPIYLKPDGSYLITKNGNIYHLSQHDPDKPEGLWEEAMAFIGENPDSVQFLEQDENPPEIQQMLDEMNSGCEIAPEPEVRDVNFGDKEIGELGYTQNEINAFMAAMMDNMGVAQAKKSGKQIDDIVGNIDFSKALGEL